MANVKKIFIRGSLPFNFTDQNPRLVDHMAPFLTPSFGLTLSYDHSGQYMQPNARGSLTTYYPFVIKGEEAVAARWVMQLRDLLQDAGAEDVRGTMRDVENGGPVENL